MSQSELSSTPREDVPYMNTLTSCVNKVVKDGYVDTFQTSDDEGEFLHSLKTEKNYRPEEVSVVNFYRFEGQSDPGDNAIMYVIETADGQKGVLIDAYGAYGQEGTSKFMKRVEDLNKITTKKPQNEC